VTAPVIVTRAAPGAAATAARLVAAGYTPIVSPVLLITPDPAVPLSLAAITHLIFTSANGVAAFAARSDARAFTVWCVGPATTAAARAAGFDRVIAGDGGADELVAQVLADPASRAAHALHIANADAAGAVAARLTAAGMFVRFAPLYRAEPARVLSPAALAQLRGGRGTVALVHSARAAAAFAALSAPLDLAATALVAVSEKAAAPLICSGVRAIHIAARPNEDALFAALAAACLSL
jgi:uroporphyrinogen-III synthase